jgi:hypothetical protein
MGTKTTKKRAKLGRKRIDLSDKETLEKIKHLAGLGLSDKAIATSLGVSPRTILRRKKDCVIFGDTIKEGKIRAIEKVSNALYDSATGRTGEKPSTAAQIFFLKNRGASDELGAWKDRLEQTTNYSVNLADIIGTRKQALAHASTPAIAPNDALIINNDD